MKYVRAFHRPLLKFCVSDIEFDSLSNLFINIKKTEVLEGNCENDYIGTIVHIGLEMLVRIK